MFASKYSMSHCRLERRLVLITVLSVNILLKLPLSFSIQCVYLERCGFPILLQAYSRRALYKMAPWPLSLVICILDRTPPKRGSLKCRQSDAVQFRGSCRDQPATSSTCNFLRAPKHKVAYAGHKSKVREHSEESPSICPFLACH